MQEKILLVASKILHLEISSKCALKCSACPRTNFIEKINASDLDPSLIKKALQSGPEYKEILLCGNHGDPIYHKEFHSVLKLLIDAPGSPHMTIATNGSYRNEDWWLETASLLREQDYIIFGIDGLKDTSWMYRSGNDWESIDLAVRTVKKHSKCNVVWQWILFNYNEHQIEEAAQQAKNWGVDLFTLIGSSRHKSVDTYKPTLPLEEANRRFLNAYYSPQMQS